MSVSEPDCRCTQSSYSALSIDYETGATMHLRCIVLAHCGDWSIDWIQSLSTHVQDRWNLLNCNLNLNGSVNLNLNLKGIACSWNVAAPFHWRAGLLAILPFLPWPSARQPHVRVVITNFKASTTGLWSRKQETRAASRAGTR